MVLNLLLLQSNDDALSGAAGVLLLLGLIGVSIVLYFLPSIVGRRKRNAGAIFVLNLFLGWSLIGWVVAMVWAVAKDDLPQPIVIHSAVPGTFCASCGKYSPPGSRFCGNCATRIG
jgi:ABC-type Na+ efflux pump permease subunit